ncbi:membrane protein [Gordonia phage ThankyouJordi]|uniref:Membrane protein n=1 Tax=Gordonia phage ThankyouJordi TaxID=2571252 RepID=A0A4Y6EGD2_9CAUD|nr:membrane protein [Gordonia phage ThankyouJordi]QCW22217.1 membrane protein [Gordonia phage WelcomeAyanna]QDF17793.1 membrane protein [Gordonia phage ThankyouJordi]
MLVFVAAIAVPFIAILGTWVKSIIDGRDRRATIAAELDILAKLSPQSGAAQKLSLSIEAQITNLVDPPQGWSLKRCLLVLFASGIPLLIALFVTRILGPDALSYRVSIAALGSAVMAVIAYTAAKRLWQREVWERNSTRP